jgi:hypothetical protein
MLGFHDMLDNAKRRRHGYCWSMGGNIRLRAE